MVFFPYLLKVSVTLAILTLGYQWLIRYETFSKLNRVLLWINVLAAWSLPILSPPVDTPARISETLHRDIPMIMTQIPQVVGQKVTFGPVALTRTSDIPDISRILLAIYLIGAGIMTARLFYRILHLAMYLRKLPKTRTVDGLLLICDNQIRSPFSIFNAIVFNPKQHSEEELAQVLAHESEHALGRHSLDLLLAEIQTILLWFNPFAFRHRRLVRENLEYLADQAVLGSGYERKTYQLNLLKTALSTDHFPLSNSFAQSVLKRRIQMMNKKPSRIWVLGKYALLLLFLYTSAAFVAPYQPKIKVLATSAIAPLAEALSDAPNIPVPGTTDFKPASLSKKTVDVNVAASAPASKWIVKKGGTLYYAISPLATWQDITAIINEVKNYGADMAINSIEYDPLQLFISKVTVHIRTKGGMSKATEGDDPLLPIKGESGYMNKTGSMGTGGPLPEALAAALEKDYQKALAIAQRNASAYLEAALSKKLTDENLSFWSSSFAADLFEGEKGEKILNREGIGKSDDGLLKITADHRHAAFYLDGKTSTYTEVNDLDIHKVDYVKLMQDAHGRQYVLVVTK